MTDADEILKLAREDLACYAHAVWPEFELARHHRLLVEKLESVERGRAVFETNECAKCHGEQGRADGPSSTSLRDDWGNPILPYDLTKGHLKGGNTAQDIYRVFMTGLSGTPMPSFSRAIQGDDAWDLVHYIQSLSRTAPTVASAPGKKGPSR